MFAKLLCSPAGDCKIKGLYVIFKFYLNLKSLFEIPKSGVCKLLKHVQREDFIKKSLAR